jgi:two-component system response regulator HydG
VHKASVLVVDDSADMVATLARYLADHDFDVQTATSGAEALDRFAAAPSDVVLTDLRMKGLDGIDVLGGIQRVDPQTPVVIMTAFGNIESAVDAIQRGAHNYVTKPFKMAAVRVLLHRAAADRRLREQNRQLKAAFNDRFAAHGLLGTSSAMRELDGLIDRVADAPSPVLIVGETGTGKELVARAIHVESARRDAPFVTVSCAALPEPLLENELFGRAAAAPGPARSPRGMLVEAEGGTLFLDEVGDLPLALQGKLVGVLQSGVSVRFIASTHVDLQALVRERSFREDLFFRLNVVPIRVPPLRERREDIPLLVEHFLGRASERTKVGVPRTVSPAALRALESYTWSGNVRELENVIERLVVTTTQAEISVETVRSALTDVAPQDPIEALAASSVTLDQLEGRYIAAVLRHTKRDKAQAARILGVDLSTLYRRAKQRRS